MNRILWKVRALIKSRGYALRSLVLAKKKTEILEVREKEKILVRIQGIIPNAVTPCSQGMAPLKRKGGTDNQAVYKLHHALKAWLH